MRQSESDGVHSWWDTHGSYRTTLTRPTPWEFDGETPVEALIDFEKLLAAAGTERAFASESVRVVEHDPEGQPSRDVAAEWREETDPETGRPRKYLAWTARARKGATGGFDVYFDGTGKTLPETRAEGRAPVANLLTNPRFTEHERGIPAGWEVDDAAIAAFESAAARGEDRGLWITRAANGSIRQEHAAELRQRVDVRRYAGRGVRFEAQWLCRQGIFGKPVTVEIEQYREDGSRIPEYAVDPRWLTLELAPGQRVRFSQTGRFNPQAAEAIVRLRLWLDVDPSCFGRQPTPEELATEIHLDHLVLRPGERWPWPAVNPALFVEGADPQAPPNRAVALTGKRRFSFNGASAGTVSSGRLNPNRRAVHWGPVRGTMEFYLKPAWSWDDGKDHLLYEGLARAAKTGAHSSLRKLGADGDNQLSFSILDAAAERHTVQGKAELREGRWHHLAVTWDHPKAELQLFCDGCRIGATGPADAPWPSTDDPLDPALSRGAGIAPGDRRGIPMVMTIGGDQKFAEPSAEIVLDQLRISDVVRYSADFQPDWRRLDPDPDTRALFRFENTTDGMHDGDDTVIETFFTHPEPPQQETVPLDRFENGKIHHQDITVAPYPPETLFEANRPENNPDVCRPAVQHPDPRFIESRPRTVQRRISGVGTQEPLTVGGDFEPLMRWEAYTPVPEEHDQAIPLPRWRANDNVVPFSYESLRQTLAPGIDDEMERAGRIFRYCTRVTRYFNANMIGERIFDEPLPVRYHLVRMLNIYFSHQCGPLNYPLRKMLLLCGLSSNDYMGTGHQFQQAYYRGNYRLYDMSKRLYWLHRDNTSVIGVRDIHDDPWLMVRQSGRFNAYIPGRPGCARFIDSPQPDLDQAADETAYRFPMRPRVPHRIDLALRPGETAWMGWQNEGRWLRRNRKGEPLHPGYVPPEYGNGAIVFEPASESRCAAESTNLAFTQDGPTRGMRPRKAGEPAALHYRMLCPYVLTGVQIRGRFQGARPGMIRLSLSVDGGRRFETIWQNPTGEEVLAIDLAQHVAGRYDYELRLEIDAGDADTRIDDLQIRSPFLCSHLALPGKLQRGENRIEMVAGPVTQPVDAQLAWTERYQCELGVEMNAISFYTTSGQLHRNLFVAAPGASVPLEIALLGRAMNGAVRIEGPAAAWIAGTNRQAVQKNIGERIALAFQLRMPDTIDEGTITPFEVIIEEPDRKPRREQGLILSARTAGIIEAEAAVIQKGRIQHREAPDLSGGGYVKVLDDGTLAFMAQAPVAGRYALWLHARWESEAEPRLRITAGDQPARELTPSYRPCGWQSADQANTKMYKHYDLYTRHWGWYRIGDILLETGEQRLRLDLEKGADLDVAVIVPQTDAVDRAMMNLTQNWNYAPWDCPQ